MQNRGTGACLPYTTPCCIYVLKVSSRGTSVYVHWVLFQCHFIFPYYSTSFKHQIPFH
ncbi:hypothetical protein HanIR_Chr15g0760401 [Helianthus annuus]|nr:hypothetical protein HanIR_Chr15g0760401 [Helianthus annuus]